MKAIDYDESSTIHPIIIMAVEESNWFTRRGFEFEFRIRPTWQFTIKQRWIRVLMVGRQFARLFKRKLRNYVDWMVPYTRFGFGFR